MTAGRAKSFAPAEAVSAEAAPLHSGCYRKRVPIIPQWIYRLEGSSGNLRQNRKSWLLATDEATPEQFLDLLREKFDVVEKGPQFGPGSGARLARETFAGVYVTSQHLTDTVQIGKLLQNEQILEGMPDGVVLLDGENTIIWGNGRLREWSGRDTVVGTNFYAVLGSPEILGPDFCPFHTALATGRPSFHAPQRGEPLLPGACRPGARSAAARRST